MNHIPRKRFGQNFLIDPNIIRKIVEAIRPLETDRIVEIGPGLGALTGPLLKVVTHLDVVEIDRDIIRSLQEQYPEERLTIHGGDALKFDFGRLGADLRIVGNLPYNISTPLLFHLASFSPHVRDMHFMLQKEVVDRMVAEPSTPEYGRLGVMLQFRFQMARLFVVPPGAFRPPPKVDSAIVRMRPANPLPYPETNPEIFSRVVTKAFSQRRKTLRNTLKGIFNDEDFDVVGIDPMLRAEALSVGDFARITDRISGRDAPSD